MSKSEKNPQNAPAVILPIGLNPEKAGSATDFNSTSKLAYDYDDSYNPFEHREVDKPNTTTGALIHLLKSSLGTGILAMPNAFNNAGLVFASIMTVIVGLICTHCVWILVRCSHKICKISKTPVLGFAETAEKVFEYGPNWAKKYSRAARQGVDYALMATYYSTGCVYIVFIANTFHNICNDLLGWDFSVRIYILFVIIPCLFIGQIRNLKLLVPFSGSANVFILVTFGIVLYYIFSAPLNISDKPAIVSWTKWPVFFSTVIFAMEGIGAVMPVENSMKKPQQFLGFPSVLLIAMITVCVMYTVLGFLGYVRFGSEIQGSITLNLPTDEWPAITGQVLIGIAILFTFGLQFYIPMEILMKKLESKISKGRNIKEITIRTVIIILTGAVGIAVPDLEPVISLVGAVFFSGLGLFVPAFIECVYLSAYEGFGRFNWKLWKNIFLMIFSAIALFAGAFVSILDIIDTYIGSEEGSGHLVKTHY
ncbi:proton-coupled amino acid transporter-like protein pathetic [Chironomus tepperi]|uniref:proton-coupled amino acid transporter-like protein pathetic n=1 Tax=Chironomus tepperi TaxID=113505 RepID=UPI00391FBFBF